MKTFSTIVLTCDKPSPYTNRIYPKDEVEKAIKEFMNSPEHLVLFEGECFNQTNTWNIGVCAGIVKSMSINENKEVVAEIFTLNTSEGINLESLLENECSIRLAPFGTGKISEDESKISDYNIKGLAVYLKAGELGRKLITEEIDNEILRKIKEQMAKEDNYEENSKQK